MKKWLLIIILIILILTISIILKNNIVSEIKVKSAPQMSEAEIQKWYGNTTTIFVNGAELKASIANNDEQRELGLSGTPMLPIKMAKLFIFDYSDTWSFWMKDMHYPIDIVWLDKDKKVVHIEKNLSPDTYPSSTFKSDVPALSVLELPANYSDVLKLELGSQFSW